MIDREQMMSAAEQAWQCRNADPERSKSLAAELAAKGNGDMAITATARIIELFHDHRNGTPERFLAERERLELEIVSEPLWASRLAGFTGIIYRALGSYPEALVYHHRALAISEQLDDRAGIARTLDNIGIVHQDLGAFPEALEYHLRALAIKEEVGDQEAIAASLLNIGCMHYAVDSYADALDFMMRSLRINEQIGIETNIAGALQNIGNVYDTMGSSPEALEYYRRSLAIREKLGNQADIASSLNNIGLVHSKLGMPSDAMEYHRHALAICEAIGDRAGMAHSLESLGSVLAELGEHADALEYRLRALAISEQTGNRADAIETRIAVAHSMIALGDADAALPLLEEGLATANELGMPSIVASAHGLLVDVHEQAGRHALAIEHLREQHRIDWEIHGEEVKKQLYQMEATRQIEIERLRNGELKSALDQLEATHRELKQTQAQLVHAGKMSGIGQLTAGIAHEINNPINFVVSSIKPLARNIQAVKRIIERLLDDDPATPEERFEELRAAAADEEMPEIIEEIDALLGGIQTGAARTAEIVAKLRTFSRLDESDLKQADLHEGLESTLTLLGARLGDRITLRREYGDLSPVDCYPGQINQVFMNLLTNAIEAIDGSGEITITTSIDGTTASVAITDSGCGISPENLERIFDPFFTTKDVGEGTGLGLAISYGIVRKHGGEIGVVSNVGSGSTFTVRLPVGF